MELEKITPAKAEKYLNSNHGNRALRSGLVERYAADMRAKKWTQCLMPIAFYEDGTIADGQHRLWAIVESGVAQSFYVVRGVKRDEGLNIDTGAGRTIVDNARISGLDTGLSNALLAACRAIEEGVAPHRGMSNSEKLAQVAKHREAGQWVVSNGPRTKGLRNGAIYGAIGRAWYKEADKDKLKRFCDVLGSGFSNGTHESAAIAIRNYLLASSNSGTSALWRDTFLKVQAAIKNFMKDRPITVIKKVSEEMYPL